MAGSVTSSKNSGRAAALHGNRGGRLPNPDIDWLPIVHSFAILTTWPSPTDSCSPPSAGAVRRCGGVGTHPGRGPHDRPSRPDRPAGRRHRRARDPRHRPPAFEPEVLLTAQGIGEAARVLGFETPSDFVRAYPMSREWLTLLIRRMDAVASVYRLAASLSPGTGSRLSHVEFHRRGRFDATITLHDGRSFGVVR